MAAELPAQEYFGSPCLLVLTAEMFPAQAQVLAVAVAESAVEFVAEAELVALSAQLMGRLPPVAFAELAEFEEFAHMQNLKTPLM